MYTGIILEAKKKKKNKIEPTMHLANAKFSFSSEFGLVTLLFYNIDFLYFPLIQKN